MTPRSPQHGRAVWWLVAGTAVWGVSFPVMKVLHELQVEVRDSWFLAAWMLTLRFAAAGLLLAMFMPKMLCGITKSEWIQGLGLALTAGPGLLLQADALGQTAASTSAFLTQFYCVLLPLWACLRSRRLPGGMLLLCTLLVLAGVGILSKISPKTLTIGPGEWKTLLAAVFFTAQILWLERPVFASNRTSTVSVIMFLGIAFMSLPLAVASTPTVAAFTDAWGSLPVIGLMVILTVGCTLFSYGIMNHWQKHVSSIEAGLIYCMEPVFTACFVLFMPAWFSLWTGVPYANESLTQSLMLGGGLITLANILLQLRPPPRNG